MQGGASLSPSHTVWDDVLTDPVLAELSALSAETAALSKLHLTVCRQLHIGLLLTSLVPGQLFAIAYVWGGSTHH